MRILILCLLAFSQIVYGISFPLPFKNEDIVGKIRTVYSKEGDTFADIAERYDLGYLQLVAANPYLNPWVLKAGSEIILPRHFILPPGAREGVVINLAEYRMYVYPKKGGRVYTYPLGIGREGWESPIADTIIKRIEDNPSWYPPQSIIDEHLAEYGEQLPRVVGPGPDNPLGPVKLTLGLPGYLIHGSNKEFGVGMRVSHGCFRMFNNNVTELADLIAAGTKVRIIKERFKLGRDNNKLYLEIHPPLEDDFAEQDVDIYADVKSKILSIKSTNSSLKINWNAVREVVAAEEGIPLVIASF